jgi:hypothetical protein
MLITPSQQTAARATAANPSAALKVVVIVEVIEVRVSEGMEDAMTRAIV